MVAITAAAIAAAAAAGVSVVVGVRRRFTATLFVIARRLQRRRCFEGGLARHDTRRHNTTRQNRRECVLSRGRGIGRRESGVPQAVGLGKRVEGSHARSAAKIKRDDTERGQDTALFINRCSSHLRRKTTYFYVPKTHATYRCDTPPPCPSKNQTAQACNRQQQWRGGAMHYYIFLTRAGMRWSVH